MDPRRCTGIILAGGKASRFGGEPKGLELVAGRRILDRVADALTQVSDALLIISSARGSESWLPGVPVAEDIWPAQGTLVGIHSALTHARTSVIVVGWDMPFVSAPLLSCLRAYSAHAEAAVPINTARDDVEPLCAWYSQACLPAVEKRLEAGAMKVASFLEDVRCARLSGEEVAQFGDPETLFMNVNTPEDLERAQLLARDEEAL